MFSDLLIKPNFRQPGDAVCKGVDLASLSASSFSDGALGVFPHHLGVEFLFDLPPSPSLWDFHKCQVNWFCSFPSIVKAFVPRFSRGK
jgi:hypothetical protein